jgi:hypothetical protein
MERMPVSMEIVNLGVVGKVGVEGGEGEVPLWREGFEGDGVFGFTMGLNEGASGVVAVAVHLAVCSGRHRAVWSYVCTRLERQISHPGA